MKTTVPVFYTIDNSYAPYLAVSLRSLAENSAKDRKYKITVLHEDLTEENKEKIKAVATENVTVEFVPMRGGLEAIVDKMGNRLRCDYFTLTIYFRLFIPEMFKEYDKAVYIDSDTVLVGDIGELYDTQIGDNFIGACADNSVVDVPELACYIEEGIGVSRYEYINSGVLLMNLKKMRERGFEEHFLSLLTTYSFNCLAPDQDYLNAICNGNIHYLPEVWDAMPSDTKPPVEGVKLVHYNLFSKPWCYDGVQYGEYFWEYAKRSGYLNEIIARKEAYGEENIISDNKCMALLLSRGLSIPGEDLTFKKLKDSGVTIAL